MGKTKKSKTSVSSDDKPTSNIAKVQFDWRHFLCMDANFCAAPVSLFTNIPISDNWNKLIKNKLKVEVLNPTAVMPSGAKSQEDCFWIASVIAVQGFFLCLRWTGYEDNDEDDFWLNICEKVIHPIGYAQKHKQHLLPPKNIAHKQNNWKKYLYSKLIGSHTLPDNYRQQILESLKSDFQIGLKLEMIDINRVSSVRSGVVVDVKGTRLQVTYDLRAKQYDYTNSLWCDQRSPLIHPVGWAQLVGHELKSSAKYAESSLHKIRTGEFESSDADFSYFPHLYHKMKESQNSNNQLGEFKAGMRLEAIDALNMRTIGVAFVFKVLRFDYMMIGIDGKTSDDGSDSFCYHRDDCLPINYCKHHKAPLDKPDDYKNKKFDYSTYLRHQKVIAAPEHLFKSNCPHSSNCYKKGMYVEAVDLMEPHLVCPAMVKQVAGKLLKISFCGWSEDYDQWIDCTSPEIYPIGYCQITGYMLEHPKTMQESNSLDFLPEQTSTNNRLDANNNSNYGDLVDVSRSTLSPDFVSTKKRKKHPTSFDYSKKIKTFEKQCSTGYDSNATEDNSSDTVSLSIESSIDNQPVTRLASSIDEQATQTKIHTNKNPLDWSVQDTTEFLIENNLSELVQELTARNVTGAILLNLSEEECFEIAHHKLGPSSKLYFKICELKEIHNYS